MLLLLQPKIGKGQHVEHFGRGSLGGWKGSEGGGGSGGDFLGVIFLWNVKATDIPG